MRFFFLEARVDGLGFNDQIYLTYQFLSHKFFHPGKVGIEISECRVGCNCTVLYRCIVFPQLYCRPLQGLSHNFVLHVLGEIRTCNCQFKDYVTCILCILSIMA